MKAIKKKRKRKKKKPPTNVVAFFSLAGIAKALELFMIALCAKATEQARVRNSKRITARDLKQVVLADEQFDFLEDIMAKVPDVPYPSENNQGNVSDEEVNTGGGPSSAKKPRKPRTRKPKEEDSC